MKRKTQRNPLTCPECGQRFVKRLPFVDRSGVYPKAYIHADGSVCVPFNDDAGQCERYAECLIDCEG